MLKNGKYGLFFKKEISSVSKIINYCEEEEILIVKLRQRSIKGITQKYDWNSITLQYLKVFKSLVS